jgi:hypothetical protein
MGVAVRHPAGPVTNCHYGRAELLSFNVYRHVLCALVTDNAVSVTIYKPISRDIVVRVLKQGLGVELQDI